ncbi:MAG: sulfite exporter TauE/SafE family protein [Candidatus Micrarchaeota archaeon]
MNKKMKVKGMRCSGCEKTIEDALKPIDGVESVKVNYTDGTLEVAFDENKTNADRLMQAVSDNGYSCAEFNEPVKQDDDSKVFDYGMKLLGVALLLSGLALVFYVGSGFIEGIQLPEISQNMSYGLLFIVGLLTGFHCITMCGGFVVSYTAKHAQEGTSANKSHLLYAAGKTLSYTIIGAAFGLLGSIIVFTPLMRGAAALIAGLFLVVFGLNMLNVFPALRKIRIKTPAFLSRFVGEESRKQKSPLAIGLLNGLMIACGPLQAIYIMAAGTGSMVEGAKLLLIFGLGTLPVMLGFGFLTGFLSSKLTRSILNASGFVVILLGLIMFNQGLALTGTGLDANSLVVSANVDNAKLTDVPIALENGVQTINMDVTRYGFEPNKFVLQKGVPVKWVINGKELNGCNNAIIVPKLGLNFKIKPGEQVIEFTPEDEGVISWSCWMGMIPGSFVVKDNVASLSSAEVEQELASIPQQPASSCGYGGGSASASGTCGLTS